MRVAGRQTDADWRAIKMCLHSMPTQLLWESVYRQFYLERIKTRYLSPMKAIMRRDRQLGEGFAIVALFCTLVEYLESCERGDNFHYVGGTGYRLQQHEYDERQASRYFKDFLQTRSPFSTLVPTALVDSFYRDVRCGLLHEARTKGGWIISSKDSSGRLVSQSGAEIKLFRNALLPAVEAYLADYRRRLLSDSATQQAFIRKFDHLCAQ